MTIEDIRAAVKSGKTVHWVNRGYVVVMDRIGQFLIKFIPNGHCIGLTNLAGDTLNGKPEDFFVSDPPHSVHCEDCGSEDVLQDAYASWNPELQMWEVSQVFPQAFCETCQGETKTEERILDASPQTSPCR